MNNRTLLSLLLLLVSFGQLTAQRCRVFGVVRDQDGNPIELATVRIPGTAIGTACDLQGRYSLTFQSRDTVVVQYSMIGYESRKRTLYNPRDSVRIDVMLPTYGAMLGEATVVGQGVQTGTTQHIKPVDTHLMPSTTGNGVEEIIATQAGVSTHNELSSQYNVRGGSFDENCVYLNGIEVYRPLLVRSGQQEGLSIINPDMVESIAFSSGGFEARYGDKMSSVLDITYKRPTRLEASANASLLGAGVYAGWGNKKLSAMTSVRYKTTRYLLGSLDTNGEYKPSFLDYQLVLQFHPSERWSLDVMGNLSDNNYRFIPSERDTRFGTMDNPKSFRVYFDGQEKDQFRTLFGSATLTRHFSPKTFAALKFSSYATREQENYDIQGQYWLQDAGTQEQMGVGTYMEHARNHLRAHVFDLGARFRTQFSSHTLQAGIDWKREIIEEDASEWEMRDSMGYSLPHNPDELKLIYSLRSDNSLTTDRIELFAQDTWRRHTSAGLFNLTYGLRFTYGAFNSEALISPRASFGFLPENAPDWTFRFATGLYYQAPFYKEFRDTTLVNGVASVSLNRDLKSQRSFHLVCGADYTFRMAGRPFRFTAEAYYKALGNLIPYSVDNVRVVYYGRNMSKGFAAGVDLKIFGEFVPGTDSWLTLSIMRTKEKLGGMWLPRPTDQRYALNLYFTDYFPGTTRWSFTLKAALADGLPFGPPHTERQQHVFRAPAYKRVDIGLSYKIIGDDDDDAARRGLSSSSRRKGRHRSENSVIKSLWIGLDAFNLLGISNVNSYYWVTDITDTQYAVPNYLTGRQINARIAIKF